MLSQTAQLSNKKRQNTSAYKDQNSY